MLDRVVRLAARSLGVPIAQINLVGSRHRSRAWVGASLDDCPPEISFCQRTVENGELTVLHDIHADPAFASHELVQCDPPARTYAGIPLTAPFGASAAVVGTLCVIDVEPRSFSAAEAAVLNDLARLAETLLAPDGPHPVEVLDGIPDAFFAINDAWEVTYVNERGVALSDRSSGTRSSGNRSSGNRSSGDRSSRTGFSRTGFSRTGSSGNRLSSDVIGAPLWEAVPALDRSDAEARLREARRTGRAVEFDAYDEALNLWVDVYAHPFPHGLSVYVQDVTEQRNREQKLHLFQRAVEEAVEAVMITDAGVEQPGGPRIVYVNPAFEKMTGYRADELIGKTPRILQGAHTNPQVLGRVRMQLEAGEPTVDETVNYRKDGTPFIVQWNMAPVRDSHGRIIYWVSVQHDVTDARVMETALRSERDLLRGIMETSTAAIVLVDLDGAITFANRRAETILGLPRDELLSRSCQDTAWEPTSLSGEPIDLEDLPSRQVINTGEPIHGSTYSIQRNGERRILSVSGAPLTGESGVMRSVVLTIRDVTEQHAQASAAERFGRLMDASVNEVYLFRADTLQFVQVSTGAVNHLGYTAAELREMTPLDLKPMSAEAFEAVLRPLREEETDQLVFETTHRRKDGSTYPVEVHLQLSRTERPPLFTAIVIDVTDRREWEEQQWRATTRVHALHDISRAILSATSPDQIAAAALDRLGRLVSFDRASVVEFDRDSLTGTVLAATGCGVEHTPAGQRLSFDVPRHRKLHPDTYRYVADLAAVDRSPIEALLYEAGIQSYVNIPLSVEGDVIGILSVGAEAPRFFSPDVFDVTREVADMLSVALQKRRYEAEIVAAKEEAEEMNRLKTVFLANMSLEIRTPLTSIIGFAEVIQEDADAAQQFATIIQNSGQRLLHTLNSVLDFAQLESNTFEQTPEAFDLRPRVCTITSEYQAQAREKDISLDCVCPDDPVNVHLDEHVARRIAHNLINNAVKFTDDGHVTVVVRDTDDGAELAVSDTGIGVSDEFLPHLFDEFRQESAGDARTHEGNGLGLTITKRLVDLIGGRLTVTSEKGRGSTFTVLLPSSASEP